jgi:hypothetical protein
VSFGKRNNPSPEISITDNIYIQNRQTLYQLIYLSLSLNYDKYLQKLMIGELFGDHNVNRQIS